MWFMSYLASLGVLHCSLLVALVFSGSATVDNYGNEWWFRFVIPVP
jgi:hypothetical protein